MCCAVGAEEDGWRTEGSDPDAELAVGRVADAVELSRAREEHAEVLAARRVCDRLALERANIDREIHICTDAAVGLAGPELAAAGGPEGKDLARHCHRERVVVPSADGSDPLALDRAHQEREIDVVDIPVAKLRSNLSC